MIKAWIQSLEFVGGVTVALNENSVVAIVGPNNSGKSASLAAIRTLITGLNPDHRQTSLLSLVLFKQTSLEEIKAMLADVKQGEAYSAHGMSFHENQLHFWWNGETPNVGYFLGKQLVCELTTRSRLSDCDPAPSFNARDPYGADHPFQRMYREDHLESRASQVFRAAFKRDLVIHRGAGNTVPVYVGERPILNAGEDRISRSYLDRIEALDQIELQGDGIRSFASIIGRVITESRPIQLIDEPEAFLPPPQARLVAQSILKDSGDRQTVLATHSSDVLRGLLSDTSGRVSVVRLTRPKLGATAHHLDAAQVAQLWRDPILRFSNILDGLFHEGVILTEADGDCRFYEALSFACVPDEDRPDIHYAYTGGKDRLPVVIQSLVSLKVPVATIADFDVLNNEQPLRKIVEAHGGEWHEFEPDWQIVKKSVEQSATFTDSDKFRKNVIAELENYGNQTVVPKQTLKNIQKLTRSASAWDHAKSSGLAAIPPGEPTVAANRLLARLRELGLFVAPKGEMEGFCRSIGGHGPRWVAAALDKDIARDEELEAARAYVKSINAFLRNKT